MKMQMSSSNAVHERQKNTKILISKSKYERISLRNPDPVTGVRLIYARLYGFTDVWPGKNEAKNGNLLNPPPPPSMI